MARFDPRRLAIAPLILVLVLAAGPPARPQAPSPAVVEVRLSNYRFTPATLRLRRGQPVILRLVNVRGAHNFVAPALFAASTVEDAGHRIRRGAVEVENDETVELRLTPNQAGTYPIRCTHFLHTMYGMKGEAVVE